MRELPLLKTCSAGSRVLVERPVYEQVASGLAERFSNAEAIGDPMATGPAMLELVDADEPPLRVFFGRSPLSWIREEYARRIGEWEAWDDLSKRAHGGVHA